METRFLRTFLSVVDTASMAETARRLNITPSAVVQRIKALEDEIGRPLIRRSGRAMQPTAAGAAVLLDAERLLSVEDDLRAAAAADQETGLLRVGVVHTALTGLMPDLLANLRRKRPGIELYLKPGVSSELHAGVTDGTMDAAIIVKPQFALSKSIGRETLRREHLLFITHPQLPGDDMGEILGREPFIRHDRGNWGGRLSDAYLRERGLKVTEFCELNSLSAITVLVSRGLGVSLVPDWLPPWPEGASVRRIAVPRSPVREIILVWSKSSRRLPLIRILLEDVSSVTSRLANDRSRGAASRTAD